MQEGCIVTIEDCIRGSDISCGLEQCPSSLGPSYCDTKNFATYNLCFCAEGYCLVDGLCQPPLRTRIRARRSALPMPSAAPPPMPRVADRSDGSVPLAAVPRRRQPTTCQVSTSIYTSIHAHIQVGLWWCMVLGVGQDTPMFSNGYN